MSVGILLYSDFVRQFLFFFDEIEERAARRGHHLGVVNKRAEEAKAIVFTETENLGI